MSTQIAKEKKVEYIELIYDLIFVYIIGRNNALLHSFANGFVALPAFSAYIMTTLAVIQIWNYSTYYINIYGRHSVREHVFLFVNMFLLYFVAEGTRADWQQYHTQYHVAWALILVNIGAQYLIEWRGAENAQRKRQILRMAVLLLTEAAMVAAGIWFFRAFGTVWLSLAAILLGMVGVAAFARQGSADIAYFSHLSERAMLYVVFTFGEMIIGIASYFDGVFSVRSTYFALMAFLIVVGLFLSYGYFYDHLIDREKKTNGLRYMLLHIFLVFALNNITNGLEFMREDAIRLAPKLAFLIGSFVLFFAVLFALGAWYGKGTNRRYGRLCQAAAAAGAVFALLMILLRENMMANIALSAGFIFGLFAMIYGYGKSIENEAKASEIKG